MERNKWHYCGKKTDHRAIGARFKADYEEHGSPKRKIVFVNGFARYCDGDKRVWTSHKCHVVVDVARGRIRKVGKLQSDADGTYYPPLRIERKAAEEIFKKAFDRAHHPQTRKRSKKGAQPHHGCLICEEKELAKKMSEMHVT